MNRLRRLSLTLFLGLALASPALALQQGVSVQFREYDLHGEFEDRPFGSDDYGYGLAYEVRDMYGYWQIGALYTPDAGDDDTYDYAATPFLNLVFKDRYFLAGTGIAITYVPETDTEDEDWTDLYWDLMMGLDIPLGKNLAISGKAVYDFEEWGKLGKFDFGDVEFAAAVTFLF